MVRSKPRVSSVDELRAPAKIKARQAMTCPTMEKETPMSDMDLNITQQVLRTLTIGIATAAKADLGVLAEFLQASSKNEHLHPQARLMLDDLANGTQKMASAFANNGAPQGTAGR